MISWHRDLETARSAHEILRTAQSYLDGLTPDELGCLPVALRVTPCDVEALRAYSLQLNDAYWEQRRAGGDPGVVQELWSFFLRATIQLSRIELEDARLQVGAPMARQPQAA